MAQPLLGQILTFGGMFAPLGYMLCNGQSVPISQYDTLYNLIGTTYGGDGVTSFNLPNLQSRTPIHMGTGPGLSTYVIGQAAGAESVTLITQQLPVHNHMVGVFTGVSADSSVPGSGTILGDMGETGSGNTTTYAPYSSSGQVALAPQSIGSPGTNQAHENRQPFLAITYAIAVEGQYPVQG